MNRKFKLEKTSTRCYGYYIDTLNLVNMQYFTKCFTGTRYKTNCDFETPIPHYIGGQLGENIFSPN